MIIAKQYRMDYTVKLQKRPYHTAVPMHWDNIGGVVVSDEGVFASIPGMRPAFQCESVEQAWEYVESWRLMNGMELDGTPNR